MPQQNPHPCGAAGCATLTTGTRCEACKAKAKAVRRRRVKTYSDPRWRATSKAFLSFHPWCQTPGCERRSAEAHHLDRLGPTGPRGHDWDNLVAVCKACHITITNRGSRIS